MTGEGPSTIIRRVAKVDVRHIRGLVGQHTLDLDAPMVLVTGPNGMGKTSLLDALSLALNGQDGRLPKRLLSSSAGTSGGRGRRGGAGHEEGRAGGDGAAGWVVVTPGGGGDGGAAEPEHVKVSLKREGKGGTREATDVVVEGRGGAWRAPGSTTPDFSARASAFYQDRTGLDFPTFASFLVTGGVELAESRAALERARERLEEALAKAERHNRPEPQSAIDEARKEALVALRDAWRALPGALRRDGLDEVAGALEGVSADGPVHILKNGNLPKRWRGELRKFVSGLERGGWGDLEPAGTDPPTLLLAMVLAGVDRQLSKAREQAAERARAAAHDGVSEREGEGGAAPSPPSFPPLPAELLEDNPPILLLAWTTKHAASTGSAGGSFLGLALDDLARDVLDVRDTGYTREAAHLRRLADGLQARVRALGDADGVPGLAGVLESLSTRASGWLDAARGEGAERPGAAALPEALVEWLREASKLTADREQAHGPLAEVFRAWEREVTGRVQRLRGRAAGILRRQSWQRALGEVARALRDGAERDARLAALRDALLGGAPFISARALAERLRAVTEPEGPEEGSRGDAASTAEGAAGGELSAVAALERVKAAVTRWHAVEERQERRDRALAEDVGLQAVQDALEPALRAIGAVLGKKTKAGPDGLLWRALGLSDAELGALRETYRHIMSEFRVASHAKEIRIHQRPTLGGRRRGGQEPGVEWDVSFGDGPDFESLSTGQRGLVEVAWMLAMNVLGTGFLGHRVVLLDDFTSALDLNQLPRAAILLRRLAYVGRPEDRRQVVVTSHHEDMTNRLVDLLMPPPGETLRVLVFQGWSLDTGPEVVAREARGVWEAAEDGAGSTGAGDEAGQRGREALERVFCCLLDDIVEDLEERQAWA